MVGRIVAAPDPQHPPARRREGRQVGLHQGPPVGPAHHAARGALGVQTPGALGPEDETLQGFGEAHLAFSWKPNLALARTRVRARGFAPQPRKC